MLGCPACGTENPDIARFCLACGERIEAEAPPEEERKPVTALFVDIVGSTSRAENLDPENVLALLEPYYVRLRRELERFGGTVEKFIGDAVVAVFGAPAIHEDDPERAVRAAFAVVEAIRQLNEEDPSRDLRIRVGVTTGDAIVALSARSGEGKGFAWGDVLNTAARIQSAAPVNGVLVGEETYRETARAIEYRPSAPIEAKGKAERVAVWEALRPRADTEYVRPQPGAPLVGRSAELERLLGFWATLCERRQSGLAVLVGAPGIGKSRLVAEATAQAATAGAVLSGRCLSYGEGITYWPVVEIVKQAAGILLGDEPYTVSAKLGTLLERMPIDDPDQLRTIAASLANLVGSPQTPQGTYTTAEISQAELHWGIRRFFQLLAAERPLVVVFEDLHWAEPTLLDLINYVVEDVGGGPILLFATGRPELQQSRPALLAESEHRLAIRLEPLAGPDGEALLRDLLASHGLPSQRALDTLLARSGGNPLFLEETVRMLVESGALADSAAGAELEDLPIPTSLQALIGSRLDGLPGDQKRLAQHASIAGTVFWSAAVAHLQPNGGVVDDGLTQLEARDVVRAHELSTVAGEREWSFRHVMIRDVAYGRLRKGRRAGLHVRFAEWVSALPAGEDFVEIVAHHLEQACLLAREVSRTDVPPPVSEAVSALVHAAEKAERREGNREANRFYARALELLGADEQEQAIELRLRRARVTMFLGEFRLAREELLAVADGAQSLGRADLRAGALLTLANIDRKQGLATDSRPRLLEAAALAGELGDTTLRAKAAFESANLHAWFDSDSELAIRELTVGLALAEELDDRSLRLEGHMRLGTIYSNNGRLAEAEQQYEVARVLAGRSGSFRDEARATALLCYILYYRGDVDHAESLALQALAWLERTGDIYLQLQTLRLLARFALLHDDLALAEQRLHEAMPIALEFGGWLVVDIYRFLVEVLVRQNRIDEARELCAFAARDVPEEDPYARASLLIAEALIRAAEQDVEAARHRFTEALALLTEHKLLIDLAEAQVVFSRLLRGFGEHDDAVLQLVNARQTFVQVGAPNPLATLERELAEAAGRRAGPGAPPPSPVKFRRTRSSRPRS
jgi:class 3 adenylate cyclase/tetratricopeptide (TPR) repeat protein